MNAGGPQGERTAGAAQSGLVKTLSRLLIYSLPAGIVGSGLAGVLSISLKNILLALVMIPGSMLIMGLVGGGMGALRKFAFQGTSDQAKDTAILAGLIVGGGLAVVTLVSIGAEPSFAAGGAVVGALGGLGYLAYRSFEQARRRRLATSLLVQASVGVQYSNSDDFSTAEQKLKEAILEGELQFGSIDRTVAQMVRMLADVYRRHDQPVPAETLYKRALGVYQELRTDTQLDEAGCLQSMASMYGERGDASHAIPVCRRAVTLFETHAGKNSLEVARSLVTLGRLYAQTGKLKEAAAQLERAHKVLETQLGPGHAESTNVLATWADYSLKMGLYSQAKNLLDKVLRNRDQRGSREDGELIGLLASMARVYGERGQQEQATETYLQALASLKRAGGTQHPAADEILENCAPHLAENPTEVAFLQAIFKRDQTAAKALLDQHPELLQMADRDGWTPLHWAAFLDLERLAETLLFRSAPLDDDALGDGPPLHVAARYGRRQILMLLINKGADLEAVDGAGNTVSHAAAASGDHRTLELLVTKKARVDTRNEAGDTPLHVAAERGDEKMAVELLAKGAKINELTIEGRSPLHVAIDGGHLEVAQCLIFNGADLEIKDETGKTALDRARTAGFKDLVSLLESYTKPTEPEQAPTATPGA